MVGRTPHSYDGNGSNLTFFHAFALDPFSVAKIQLVNAKNKTKNYDADVMLNGQ